MSTTEPNSGLMKGIALGILLTLVVMAVGAFVVLKFGLVPVNVDAKPSSMERSMAGMARDAAVAREAPTTENPIKLSDANLMDGMKLYASSCQGCHGGPGGKDNVFAHAMYPSIPQFPPRKDMDLSEQEIYWIGKHGFRLTGMPAFTDMMKDDELWKTALFIKNMSKLPPAVAEAWKKTAEK